MKTQHKTTISQFFSSEISPLFHETFGKKLEIEVEDETPQPNCEYCEDTLLDENEDGDKIPCMCTLSFEGDDDPRDTNNWELD